MFWGFGRFDFNKFGSLKNIHLNFICYFHILYVFWIEKTNKTFHLALWCDDTWVICETNIIVANFDFSNQVTRIGVCVIFSRWSFPRLRSNITHTWYVVFINFESHKIWLCIPNEIFCEMNEMVSVIVIPHSRVIRRRRMRWLKI